MLDSLKILINFPIVILKEIKQREKMNNGQNNRSIAIIGSRGIPNKYGGFEKFTEYLSKALFKQGISVCVSCEKPDMENPPKECFGVNLFYFPVKPPSSPIARNIYEFIYDGYSLLWASRKVDVVYMLGYSAAFWFFIPKLFGKKLWVNPDGMEWKRSKFNPLLKVLLKMCEKLAVFWSDEIVADSKEIKRYFDSRYSTNVQFIPYGAKPISEKISWDSEKLPERIKGVTPNPSYWLVVARLEPENNIHIILEAYVKSNVEKPLLVVGNFSSPKYKATVMDIVNQKPEKQVIFAGGIYNPESLNMLRQNCFGYVHGHSVGGTNPSLLEIMTMKTVILAHANPFNREVCGDSVVYFDDSDDLRAKMETVDANIEDFVELKEKSYQRVKAEYCWDTVIDKYNSMFDELLPKNYDKVMNENHVNAK